MHMHTYVGSYPRLYLCIYLKVISHGLDWLHVIENFNNYSTYVAETEL